MKIIGIGNIFQQKQNRKKETSFGTTIKGFPGTIELGVSKNCNLRCSYCPNSMLEERTPDVVISLAFFDKILRDLKDIDFDGILHFHRFNEPLKINVEEYIRRAKQVLPRIRTELFTNGVFLNKKRLESLRETPLDAIIVTQHTPKGFVDGLRDIPDELLGNVDVKYGNELLLINRAGVLGDLRETLNEPCYSIHCTLGIDSDGKVPICIDDYHRQVVLGDLHDETMQEIWEKPYSTALRATLDGGNRKDINICKDCDRVEEKRILSADLSKNSALYRKWLLENYGDAHLVETERELERKAEFEKFMNTIGSLDS